MIRKALREDMPALSAFLSAYFAERGQALSDAEASRVSGELAACAGSGDHEIFLSFGESSSIDGFILVHWCPFPLWKGREGYISDLVVGSEARGSGAGTKLLDFVEAEARKRGCVRLMLNNPKEYESYKRGFYRKRGFEERANFANFIKKLN